MPKKINNQENKNHKFLPYLVKDFNCDGQYIIITFYLSEKDFVVLSDFVFPTVEQVLKKCKKTAKRAPNSFIIFRMFFNQSIKYVPPSNVGKISQIAKSVWAVVSEDLRQAFILLEGKVKNSLRKTRAPSFIMHHGNDRNRKIRRFSTSHEINESLNKNIPSLNFSTTSETPESYTYNYEPQTFPPFMPFMENFENFQEFEVPAESSKDPNSLQSTVPEQYLFGFTTSNWNPPGVYSENDLELLNLFVNDATNTTTNYYNDFTMTNETFLYDRETTGEFMRNDQIDQIGQIGQIGQTHVEILSHDTAEFAEFCSLLDNEEICNLDFRYSDQFY